MTRGPWGRYVDRGLGFHAVLGDPHLFLIHLHGRIAAVYPGS